MQTLWLPQSICSMIDRTTRNFIWKGNSGRGIHYVAWDKITRCKRYGGLGVRRAREANTSLLGKLVWDLQQQSTKLWVRILRSKYHSRGNFLFDLRSTRSFIWNSIIKAENILLDGYSLRIGAGNVSFWYEPWSRLGSLCNLVDYVVVHDTDVKVSDILVDNDINFFQLMTQIPITIKEEIQNIHFSLNPKIPDVYIWKDNIRGDYTAKAGYA